MTHSYRDGRKVNQSGGRWPRKGAFFTASKIIWFFLPPWQKPGTAPYISFLLRGSLVILVILFKLNIKSHISFFSRVFIPIIARMKYVVVSGGIYSESISYERAITNTCITGVISGIGKGVIGTPLYTSNWKSPLGPNFLQPRVPDCCWRPRVLESPRSRLTLIWTSMRELWPLPSTWLISLYFWTLFLMMIF